MKKVCSTFWGFALIVGLISLENQRVTQQKQQNIAKFSCGQHGPECGTFDKCKADFVGAYKDYAW